MNILSNIRRINNLIQSFGGGTLHYPHLVNELEEMVDAHILLFNQKGSVLGHTLQNYQEKTNEPIQFSSQFIQHSLHQKQITTTIDMNHYLDEVPTACKELFRHAATTLVPIIGGGNRLGSLLFINLNGILSEEEIIIAEYTATVIGSEILREQHKEIEKEARKKAIVHLAVSSLSYSEMEAVKGIFEKLEKNEGIVVASSIADHAGITRSVIVNALRKLESAGVIESRSLGMKGTYIKILNENITHEIRKLDTVAI